MKDYKYKSYKRIHKYSHASDIEKEKITKETSSYERYQILIDSAANIEFDRGKCMYLYHYFERETGPFKNLSDLSANEAEGVLNKIRYDRPSSQAAQRDSNYIKRRVNYETLVRNLFIEKGGKPTRKVPHYMVVEDCDWLKSWYIDGCYIKIPIDDFDLNTISFTYGDMHPTFSPIVNDGKEYRKKIYTYYEILKIIEKYGLPQEWNADGMYGPERYIEVQIWSDETISKYCLQK